MTRFYLKFVELLEVTFYKKCYLRRLLNQQKPLALLQNIKQPLEEF